MTEKTDFKLKPCPFCGGVDIETIYRFDGNGRYSVLCQSCGAQSAPCDTERFAVTKWNSRVTPFEAKFESRSKEKK